MSVPLSGDKIDRRARLSAEHIWDDYELEFTHRSLDALLWAYWRGMRVSRDVVPHRSWTNGDLLMKHLIRQRMTEDFRRSGRMLSGDPLSALCGMPGLQLDEGHPSLVFELLEPVLPWLSRRVADRWVFGMRAFVARYSSGGHERVEVIETAIEGWHETAVERERYDLLRPLIAAGASLGEWLASDPSPVEVFYEDLSAWSFSARMGVADTLATALRALAVARETYDECRALPHFDRRADQRIFMQECEEQGMSTHWERLDGAIALLERRIR